MLLSLSTSSSFPSIYIFLPALLLKVARSCSELLKVGTGPSMYISYQAASFLYTYMYVLWNCVYLQAAKFMLVGWLLLQWPSDRSTAHIRYTPISSSVMDVILMAQYQWSKSVLFVVTSISKHGACDDDGLLQLTIVLWHRSLSCCTLRISTSKTTWPVWWSCADQGKRSLDAGAIPEEEYKTHIQHSKYSTWSYIKSKQINYLLSEIKLDFKSQLRSIIMLLISLPVALTITWSMTT